MYIRMYVRVCIRAYIGTYLFCPCAVQVTSFETPGLGAAEAKADTSGTDQKGPVSVFLPS